MPTQRSVCLDDYLEDVLSLLGSSIPKSLGLPRALALASVAAAAVGAVVGVGVGGVGVVGEVDDTDVMALLV